jgi:hypothetical protein
MPTVIELLIVDIEASGLGLWGASREDGSQLPGVPALGAALLIILRFPASTLIEVERPCHPANQPTILQIPPVVDRGTVASGVVRICEMR